MVSLYDLCGDLRNVGIEVGVAVPCVKNYEEVKNEKELIKTTDKNTRTDSKVSRNISNENNDENLKKTDDRKTLRISERNDECFQSKIFSLIIKSKSDKIDFKGYNDIRFATCCLRFCIGKSSNSERIFWKAYSEIKGIDCVISKDNSRNLKNILVIMKEAEGFEIRDEKTMRSELEKTDDKLRGFLPLEGLDTLKESIRMMLYLKRKKLIICDEWNVGSLGLNKFNSAPFLFVIKNKEIKLILRDTLDICVYLNARFKLFDVLKNYDNEVEKIKKRIERVKYMLANLKKFNILTGTEIKERNIILEFLKLIKDLELHYMHIHFIEPYHLN